MLRSPPALKPRAIKKVNDEHRVLVEGTLLPAEPNKDGALDAEASLRRPTSLGILACLRSSETPQRHEPDGSRESDGASKP